MARRIKKLVWLDIWFVAHLTWHNDNKGEPRMIEFEIFEMGTQNHKRGKSPVYEICRHPTAVMEFRWDDCVDLKVEERLNGLHQIEQLNQALFRAGLFAEKVFND